MTQSQSPSSPLDEFASLWEDYIKSYDYVAPKRGDLMDGMVLSARADEVIIDLGAKEDAFLATRELQRLSQEERAALQPGVAVSVYVLRADPNADTVIVSLLLAKELEDWRGAEQMMERGDLVTVTATGHNKGGLLCSVGTLQGFIPTSQVVDPALRRPGRPPSDALTSQVGRQLVTKVIEVNRRRRRLILSERAAMREWRAQQREDLLRDLAVGQVRDGTVSNLCDFGAFVDLGGLDGLVHLSELSWGRVEHSREVLELGQAVQVYVLNVDRERMRVGLSLKRLLSDPWETVGDRYDAGQMVRGVVSHVVNFGAFVFLEPGIEGLIHISELASGPVGEPIDVVSPGDELDLVVLNVDVDRHRIALSLRASNTESAVGASLQDELRQGEGPVPTDETPAPRPESECPVASASNQETEDDGELNG